MALPGSPGPSINPTSKGFEQQSVKPQTFKLSKGPSFTGIHAFNYMNAGERAAVNKYGPKSVGAKPPSSPTLSPGPGAVTAPSPLAAAPSGSTPDGSAAAPPSPYDATYYNQLGAATNKASQQINNYNANIANGRTALAGSLDTLAHNQALAQTRQQNTENARGGFAQGILGQNLGETARSYQNQGSALAQKYAQNQAAWSSAIAGINQGLSTETIALQLASEARAAKTGAIGDPNAAAPGDPNAGTPAGTPAAAPGSSPLAPGPVKQTDKQAPTFTGIHAFNYMNPAERAAVAKYGAPTKIPSGPGKDKDKGKPNGWKASKGQGFA